MTETANETGNETGTETLYAGKFKTVAELEAGYKNSLPTYQENTELKKKIEEATKVPDVYNTPADIALHESDLEIVRQEAKNSGLTQAQYEKLVRERNARSTGKYQNFENAKKELGADNINILQDFLGKVYPEKVAKKLLDEAIVDKDIRAQILEQRTRMLNSNVPGINGATGAGGAQVVTEKDVLKARDEMNAARGRARIEAQQRYLKLQKIRAHQKQEGNQY